MPPHALVRIGAPLIGLDCVDAGEFAIAEDDRIRPALRQEAAVLAGFTAVAQRAALAAFDQPRDRLLVAGIVCRVLGSLGDVQGPLDRILEQPVPVHRAG